MANALWHAVTPEPHMCTVFAASAPSSASYSVRSCAGDLKRPSGFRFFCQKRLIARNVARDRVDRLRDALEALGRARRAT
jgi:hypothetical protein